MATKLKWCDKIITTMIKMTTTYDSYKIVYIGCCCCSSILFNHTTADDVCWPNTNMRERVSSGASTKSSRKHQTVTAAEADPESDVSLVSQPLFFKLKQIY